MHLAAHEVSSYTLKAMHFKSRYLRLASQSLVPEHHVYLVSLELSK